jgi:hypothetical protein
VTSPWMSESKNFRGTAFVIEFQLTSMSTAKAGTHGKRWLGSGKLAPRSVAQMFGLPLLSHEIPVLLR